MDTELPVSSLPGQVSSGEGGEAAPTHLSAGEDLFVGSGDGIGKTGPEAAAEEVEVKEKGSVDPVVEIAAPEDSGVVEEMSGEKVGEESGVEEEGVVDVTGGKGSDLPPQSPALGAEVEEERKVAVDEPSVEDEISESAPVEGLGVDTKQIDKVTASEVGDEVKGEGSGELKAAEAKDSVFHSDNEEPATADGVKESELADAVASEVEEVFVDAQVGSVDDSFDETPQQEKAELASVEVEEHPPEMVKERVVETAALLAMPSEGSLEATDEEVAAIDAQKDVDDESSSPGNSVVDEKPAHGSTIVEENPCHGNTVIEEKSAHENTVGVDKSVQGNTIVEEESAGVEVEDVPSVKSNEENGSSENFVEGSDEDFDQQEVVSTHLPLSHSSSFLDGEDSEEVKQVDVSSNKEMNGDSLDGHEKPITSSIVDEKDRKPELLKDDANVVVDDSVVIEAGDDKPDPVGDALVVEEKQENEDKGVVVDESEIKEAPEDAVRIIKEVEQGSTTSRDLFGKTDGEIVSDSDEEVESDEEVDGKELFDSAALAALLKAASGGGGDGNITISSGDGSNRFFTIERPAGLGPSAPSLRPASRTIRPNIFAPSDLAVTAEDDSNMSEEEKKLQEKIHQIRVKFLRLVQRLGHIPEDTVAAQVLYRLNLAEGIRRGKHTSRAFSLESAKKNAAELEADGGNDLDFSFNVLIIGKSGVGKSATINSIFNDGKARVSPYEPATTSVKEIVGIVDGVKVRIIDTPGLKSSLMEQGMNRRTLSAVKKFTKKCPPDIVLYVDRLDTHTRDFNDIPLLKSISSVLGSSIWLNAIVALTHAASAPPDGPNGAPLSYEVFVAQRSHIVQQAIRQAAGDMRLMNPVALVENHMSCRKNRDGQRILPNGQIWRPQLLLLCYSSKILSEANSLLKLQDSSASKLFGFRVRSPPLPYLLSSLLQSRVHPKLPNDQTADIEDADIDLADLSDLEQEGEDEYDQLPPFKPLRKVQIESLSREQKKAYFEEYDYRVKLLQKKQWREDLRRMKELKKRGKGQAPEAYGDMVDEMDQDNGAPAAVPVPMPDMVLPPSFDCDNPGYRYRFLEPTAGLLARPVLDNHGWDHDCGYDGVSLESSLALASRFPAAVAVQVTKDKKEFNIHLDSSLATKYGESGSALAGFDIQTVGRQLAYILRGDTKFKVVKGNKTAAGLSVTFLGENIATGLKVEDQISLGKRLSLVGSTGTVRSQGDMAYGANLEARLKDQDFPVGQDSSTLGLSLMKWRGDLALGANLQTQVSIGRSSKMVVRLGLNNKLSGQISVRTSSSEHLQIALIGLLPIATTIIRALYPNSPYFAN